MHDQVFIDEKGLARISGAATCPRAVEREILTSIVEVERLAIKSNLICWALIVGAASQLPNWRAYILPLVLRLLAMIATRFAFADLREKLRQRGSVESEVGRLSLALAFGGLTWAATLLPIIIEPFLNPARMLVAGAVLIGISIVVTMLLPVPRLAVAFCTGFVLTCAVGMPLAPSEFAINSAFGLAGFFAIFVSYGLATLPRHRRAAETLIENRRLSEHLAESLANAEFLAYRDPLTGMLNRRAFFNRAEEQASSTRRHVLTIDLDHFKQINDNHGHSVGDRVLIGVAAALNEVIGQLPSGDHFAVRLGGEEFALVIDIADPELALMIGEMVRHAIVLVGVEIARDGLSTTASIGVAAWDAATALDSVLNEADQAMYRAKQAGRDQVAKARLSTR